ncbi:hypothetical protein L1D15_11220 [Vibrio sp. Isolate25]|uniref:hypothetical protein n=1 Tax=Vibrio sp. Isolate25 TaxID=2908535 RepID=UPI001EFEA2DF|nr:hypothetical protein [Vibrio sp. Isolate25]MCG9597285.1 hypothetical protein [Vibrio sp. Isolate25]
MKLQSSMHRNNHQSRTTTASLFLRWFTEAKKLTKLRLRTFNEQGQPRALKTEKSQPLTSTIASSMKLSHKKVRATWPQILATNKIIEVTDCQTKKPYKLKAT